MANTNNILIICNEHNTEYYHALAKEKKGEEKLITGQKSFSNLIINEDLDCFDLCIIQVELNWDNRKSNNFYGFEIAKRLRKAGLKCIVYFLHLFPAKHFNAQYSRYALLRVNTFHKLIKTEANTSQIASQMATEKMSQLQWEDITETLLDERSLVQELIHDLKNQVIQSGEEQIPKIIAAIDHSFLQLANLLPDHNDALQAIQSNLLQAIGSPDRHLSPQEIVEQFAAQITPLAPAGAEDEEDIHFPQTQWKVLLVEDDPNVTKELIEGFKRNYVTFENAYTGSDALEMLHQDKNHQIAVLLCDLRLKEAGTENWQPLQGYDVIEKVRKDFSRSKLLSFFVLTSAKKRLINLTKNFKTNITADYKNYVLSSDGALNLFMQKLRDSGGEIFFRVRSRPKLSAWTKKTQRFYQPLSIFYREHLYALDYDLAEQTINQEAEDLMERIESGLLKKGEMEFTITLNLSERKETDTVAANADAAAQALVKFRDHILVGRRIALALYLKGHSEDKIFDLMQPGADVTNRKASKDLLFKTTLALSFSKDFPDPIDIEKGNYLKSNLLLEEINWLKDAYDANFNLEKIRLHVQDANIVWGILDDIRYSLDLKINGTTSGLSKKELDFLKKPLGEISNLKEIKSLFKMVSTLVNAHQMKKAFQDLIREEIENVKNAEIRKVLQNYIK